MRGQEFIHLPLIGPATLDADGRRTRSTRRRVQAVLSIQNGGGGAGKAPWLFLPPDINMRATSLRELINDH